MSGSYMEIVRACAREAKARKAERERLRVLEEAFPKTSKMGKAVAKETAIEEAARPKPYFGRPD